MVTQPLTGNKAQDGCDTKCQAQENARSIARGAAENFQAVANWLNAAAAFFALISAALLAGSVWAPWLFPWGIATLGLSAALFLVAGKASEISRLFNEEAGNSLSWFTKANLNGMRNQMFAALLGLSSLTILGGFGFTKIGEIVEKAIMQGPELVKDITPALSCHVGAFTFLVTDVIGTGVMAGFVQHVTSQQEEGLA